MELISVIVPVYRTEPYLARCLDSILAQTWSNLQVIVVDDGSPDRAGEIADQYAEKDTRVTVLHQPNRGVSSARNAGLAAARGDYITFVDSDDALQPQMYETLIKLALQYRAPITHCGYLRVNENGTEKAVAGTGELVVQNRREAMECLLLGRRFVGSLCNKLFRRDLLEGLSLREDLRINEDVLLAYQLFCRAEKSVYIDTPDYIYYVREGSACTAEQQNKKEEDLLLAAELIARDSVGTEFETAAHVRQIDILLIVYQWALFRGEQVRCAELKKKLEELRPYLPALSTRQRLKRRILTGAPRVYRWAYACYSRLRTENWDVS